MVCSLHSRRVTITSGFRLGLFPLDDMRERSGETVPVAGFPFYGDRSPPVQLVQNRAERAVADLEDGAGNLLQALADRQAVQRPEREDFQQTRGPGCPG